MSFTQNSSNSFNRDPRQDHSSNNNEGSAFAGVVAIGAVGAAAYFFGMMVVLVAAPLIFVLSTFMMADAASVNALEPRHKFANVLLVISGVLTLLVFPLVIWLHLVPYAVMGWVVTGVYAAALVLGVLEMLSGIAARLWALMCLAVLVVAMVVLPPPAAAGDPNDEESQWKVTVLVHNADGEPIEEAIVNCGTIMIWERDWSVKGQPRLLEFTDEAGRAEFTFSAETRLKAAICGAYRSEHHYDGGYVFRASLILNPFKGGHFVLPLELERLQGRSQDAIPWAPADSTREATEINVAAAP